MTSHDHDDGDARRPADVTEQNIRRLLDQAYRPEAPDPAFVRDLTGRLCAAARDAGRTRQVLRTTDALRASRRQRFCALAAAASLTVLALGLDLLLQPRTAPRKTDPVAVLSPAKTVVPEVRSKTPPPVIHEGNPTPPPVSDAEGLAVHEPAPPDEPWLTPRPRPETTPLELLALGGKVQTGAGERRRLGLDDGSVLYLNENTTLSVPAERQVALANGEVFVEVAPRQPGSDGATFVVKAGDREVAALGTKFDVRAADNGAGVVVTQGKVRVSGPEQVVQSGQELEPGSAEAGPAPRATYVLDWARDLMVAADSPLVPRSRYAGGALVATAPGGEEAPLSLRNYHVDLHVEDGFARTTIDQTYFNHEAARLEGTFYFPLPADASLSRLAMYVDGHLMEGGMAERDHAREVFEAIVRRQKDPALLEWVDGTTFKMRVFPLEPRQEKRIILSYTQRLPSLYGRSEYRFPAGHSLGQVRDWSFHARVKDGARLDWSSPSHSLRATKDGGDLLFDGAAGQVKVDRDVVLTLTDRAVKTGTPARFSSAESEGNRYLMLRYRPSLAGKAERQRRDWVFLFESSADRDPLLARTQVEVVRTLLANAEHDDTFALLTAGSRVRAFAKEARPATPENVTAALDFLDHTHLVGALDLGGALAAAEPYLKAGRNPYLVHLGSGLPALGEGRADVLARRLPEGTRYVGVAVGKHWARDFMKAAAERSDGYFTQINPDEPVRWRAFELFSTLNTPRLLGVQVVDDAEKLHFLTCAGSLAQGEELCAVVRTGSVQEPLPKSLAVSGTLDGKPYSQVVPVKDVVARADYLPRTWTKLRIDQLLAEDPTKNRPEIVALSRSMYVMTPFTSLLVLENKEMYAQYGVDTGRKDHWALYSCPQEVPARAEVLGDEVAARRERRAPVPPGAKPSAEQVLQTVLVRVPPQALSWPSRGDETAGRRVVTAHDLYSGAFALPEPVEQAETLDQDEGKDRADPSARKKETAKGAAAATSLVGAKADSRPTPASPALQPAPVDLPFGASPPPAAPARPEGPPPAAAGASRPAIMMPTTNGAVPVEEKAPLGKAGPSTAAPMAPRGGMPPGGGRGGIAPLAGGMMPPAPPGGPGPLPPGPANATRIRSAPMSEGGSAAPAGLGGGMGGFGNFGGGGFMGGGGALGGNFPGGYVGPQDGLGRAPVGGPGNDFRLNPYANLLRDGSPAASYNQGVVPAAPNYGMNLGLGKQGPNWADTATRQLGLTNAPDPFYFRSLPTGRPAIPGDDWTLFRREADQKLKRSVEEQTRRLELRQDADKQQKELNLDVLEALKKANDAAAKDVAPLREERKEAKGLPHGADSDAGRAREPARADDFSDVDGRTARFLAEGLPSPLYERPSYSRNDRLFDDLPAYAPGLNTSQADVQAVLEAEAAGEEPPPPGTIDPAARRLIDGARATGSRQVTFPGRDGRPALTLVCDGSGRYVYEHTLPGGLRERVVCDGRTLLHLYPELGLGARRTVSRFHRADFTALVPWVLPPVEDLAVGADVRHVPPRTVAVLPHQTAAGTPGEGQVGLLLTFAPDGRLAERRYAELPKGKVIRSETFAPDGTVQTFDADGKETGVRRLTLAGAVPPNLAPDVQPFVVLPLPLRTREHVLGIHAAQWTGRYDTLDPAVALELIAAERGDGNDEPRQVILQRFVQQGDRRPGFSTLLAATGVALDQLPLPDPQAGRQLTGYLRRLTHRAAGGPAAAAAGRGDGLFGRLAAFHDLAQPWQRADGSVLQGDEQDRLLGFVSAGKSPALTWALVALVLEDRTRQTVLPGGMAQLKRDVLEAACRSLDRVPGLGYCARYERARLCWESGDRARARELFTEAYRRCRQDGLLPGIDGSFRQALRQEGDRPDAWTPLLREERDWLLGRHEYAAVLVLARQCTLLDDQRLADELSTAVLRQAAHDPHRLPVSVAAVEYLWSTHQYERADTLLRSLLADGAFAGRASLWRLAARLAGERHQTERERDCLDRALELEYRHPPEEVDLEAVRRDYTTLLGHYERLADALVTLHQAPPGDLLRRVVSAADRWRALDVDGTVPCRSAARILKALGRDDLAWDYLTTPLAGRAGDGATALEMARGLSREGSARLAERAYRLAGEADPTNAQAVWERAQNLEQAGKRGEARNVLRQLADGSWPVEYRELQQQARGRLGRGVLLEK